jgi:hypothetical protein
MRDRHLLSLLLVAHGGLLAAVVGRGSPWATASIDCVTPTLAEIALSEPAWSLWDGVDTFVGGQSLAALAGLPAFVLAGTSAGVGKALAIVLSLGIVALVWTLLRPAGKGAAALGTAGVAFAPPVVLHASTILGNWHYAQLLFDYGAAVLALLLLGPLAAAPTPRRMAAWAGFGGVVGLGMAHSPGSVPFLGLSCLLLVLGSGRRALAGLLPAAVGFVVGGGALWWKLATSVDAARDPTLSRLFDLRPNLARLPDLVYPGLPWTLHVHDLAPPAAVSAVFTAEVSWVLSTWVGLLLAAIWAVLATRRGMSRRAVWGVCVPLAFVATFAAVCVLLDLEIERLPWRYTNVREHTHRVIPPLLVAMAVGAGPGWAAAWGWAGRLPIGAARAVRLVIGAAAATPPVLGAAATLAILAAAPGGGPAYRGVCFDVAGFKAVGLHGAEDASERCGRLSTPAREADCLAGVAWGVGFHGARVEGALGPRPRAEVCAHIPPDLRPRCLGWADGDVPVIRGVDCAHLDDDRRDLCGLGIGWFVSSLGRVWPEAPVAACDSLAEARDREACWRGPGFAAADHLHSTPDRLAATLREFPEARWAALARGSGYSIGRTYAGENTALTLCDALGSDFAAACRRGVADARRHTAAK